MRLLFISYWGIEEGLTKATVIPHVKLLSQYKKISKIYLVSIERNSGVNPRIISKKIIHKPLLSKSLSLKKVGQAIDFIQIPRNLTSYCKDLSIEKIIARGTLAGTIAYKVSMKTKIPFYVESFEPHADYMKDCGVWKKWSLKYLFQKKWEKDQIQNASGIMTVSSGFSNILKNRSDQKPNIITVPCAVNVSEFEFNTNDRVKIRAELGIGENKKVAIYVGKFCGLYINKNELNILEPIFKYFSDMHLIILTSNPKNELEEIFFSFMDAKQRLHIFNVPHRNVSGYLSASDFAISLVKPFHSAKYTSPIKHGEYWANGLPVLMTEGIGDERNFLEKEKGGVLFNEKNLMSSLEKLRKILDDPDHRTKIPELARKYRSFDTVKQAYEKMIISPDE
jgi:glycosyltransferase involved in cell wall biosynthesis